MRTAKKKKIKGNCLNCAHLKFIDDSSHEIRDGGFYCEKRNYESDREESEHLRKLSKLEYRNKAKKCFDVED